MGAGGRAGPQMKLELGSRRTESGGENILKRKGFKEGGKSMLFIVKKKKEKKKSVTKPPQLTNPFCTKLERRRRRATEDSRSRGRGASVFEELYELFKGYFPMAASDV